MTIDKSLRIRSGTVRSRSVLTRAERISKLVSQGSFSEEESPLGLPKVRVVKLAFKKKKKAKKVEGEEEEKAATEEKK